MNSNDLTPEQLQSLFAKLGPHLVYLAKLENRLFQLGFDRDDELFVAAHEAHSAIHKLRMTTHYLSCGESVGRKPRAK